MKLKLLSVAVAVAFLLGFAGTAVATHVYSSLFPVKGSYAFHGYFSNIADGAGTHVLPPDSDTPGGPQYGGCQAGGGYAIPGWVNSADLFINFILCKLNSNNDYWLYNQQERKGAEFIIKTMMGEDKNLPLSAGEINDWANSIREMERQGQINWNSSEDYTVNSLYQGTWYGSNPNDDTFYPESGWNVWAITFGSGPNKYVIRRLCANPMGYNSVGKLPNFTMTGYSRASASGVAPAQNISVAPGTQVTFTHYVRDNGPDATSPVNITGWGINSSTVTRGPVGLGAFANGQTKSFTETAIVNAGQTVCRHVRYSPSTDGGGVGNGANACASAPLNYNLQPTVAPSQSPVEQGDTAQFVYRVQNTGTTASVPARCSPQDGNGAPVAGLTLTCANGQIFPSGSGSVVVGTESIPITNQPPGTTICRQLVIQPATPSVASRTSPRVCILVAKTPYVHFVGGDVWAGGNFREVQASCSSPAKITGKAKSLPAGSMVEYGAFALGPIRDFGSASQALINGMGKKITFSNTVATLGNFGAPSHCITDYKSTFQGAPTSAVSTVNVGAPPAGNGVWHIAGNLNISGIMRAGSHQVYLVDGDVTVTGDLRYVSANPTYQNINDVPSLIIVAAGTVNGGTVTGGNIFVQAGVSNMDGIFEARNTFFTCHPKPTPVLVTSCANRLTVNGSVLAGKLDLYRTAGAAGTANPAEVFNLIPEVYLRSALNANSKDVITTADRRELPPRF